ncbi:MAG: hypothetical protein AAF677_09320 [Pseudomonadota bacterium]
MSAPAAASSGRTALQPGRARPRRFVLGAALAVAALAMLALALPMLARGDARGDVRGDAWGVPRVLFVGNSFTFQHGVPSRVAGLAAAEGTPIAVTVVAFGGARLVDTLARREVDYLLAAERWDAVVLQEFSTVALMPDQAALSREAIAGAVARLADGATPSPRVVLVETWARRADHPLFAAPGMPRDPSAMLAAVTAHYHAAAADHAPAGEAGGDAGRDAGGGEAVVAGAVVAAAGDPAHDGIAEAPALAPALGPVPGSSAQVVVAPVGRAFAQALAEGRAVHAADGYHASPGGAALAAQTIWRTLAPMVANVPR